MVQGNFCMVGTNGSGHHIVFYAQNYLEEYNNGIRVLASHLPYYSVKIDDERSTTYVLDTEQEVLSFYEYYLGLSAEARAVNQEDIRANFLVHFANIDSAPKPVNRHRIHIRIDHSGFPKPAPSTQVRIAIRVQEQDIGTPQD